MECLGLRPNLHRVADFVAGPARYAKDQVRAVFQPSMDQAFGPDQFDPVNPYRRLERRRGGVGRERRKIL